VVRDPTIPKKESRSILKNAFATLPNPIQPEHIISIYPKIKHLHMISFEQGTALSRMAMIYINNAKDCNLQNLALAFSLLMQASLRYEQVIFCLFLLDLMVFVEFSSETQLSSIII